MSFKHTERWRQHLFDAIEKEPAHPSDSPPDFHDIIAADKIIWNKL